MYKEHIIRNMNGKEYKTTKKKLSFFCCNPFVCSIHLTGSYSFHENPVKTLCVPVLGTFIGFLWKPFVPVFKVVHGLFSKNPFESLLCVTVL